MKTSKLICIFFCLLSFSVFGDNLRLDNVKLLSVTGESADLEVTLKWSNSWRNLYNNDAVYLFGKFRTKPIEGWHHIYWSGDASAHTAAEGYACEVLNGGRGLVIYRTSEGSGPSEVRLRLRWQLSGNPRHPVDASSLQSGDIPYSLQGLEMVYVPTSPFYAGDGVSSGSFSSPAFGVFPSEYDIIGTNSNFSYSGNGSESAAAHANRAADRYNQGVYTSSSRHDWCGTVFPAYWTVDFKSSRRILYFGVSGVFGSMYNAGPSGTWYLEGSADNKLWDDLWHGGPEYWSESAESYPVQQVLRVDRPGDYRYYRIRVDAPRNAGVWNNIRISNVSMTDTDLSSVYSPGPVLVDGLSLPLPSSYPSGVRGFYAMKYELTQEQYVGFLNQLPRPAQYERTIGGYLDKLSEGDYVFGSDRSRASHRNGIVLHERNINNGLPYVFACDLDRSDLANGLSDGQSLSCNYLSVGDLLSYAEWSGLRPLSELEYEKMCRGYYPALPSGGEYAWEGSSPVKLSGITGGGTERESVTGSGDNVNGDNALDGPVRAGLFVRGSDRLTTGSSFWGLSDLSGNVSEIYCNAEVYGRQLKRGVHGSGEVEENGDARVGETEWPRVVSAYGVRGGDFQSPLSCLSVSDRSMAFDYFSDFSDRKPTVGFRLGITQEPASLSSVLTLESGRQSGTVIPYDTVCGGAVYTIRGDLPLGEGIPYQYAWLMSRDDGVTWRNVKNGSGRDLKITDLQEETPAMVVRKYLYKRFCYSSSGMGESGVVGLVVGHGYRVSRLRDTLIPCKASAGFEVTTPLASVFDWYEMDNGKKLQPSSFSATRSHYELSTDDFRTGRELPDGKYNIELRIRVAGECEYRQKLEVSAVPRTVDPFPEGTEVFAYNTGDQYTVTHAWGGRDVWSWKIYSDVSANRIDRETGIMSGKADTMCRITVGLVCEDCPDVEWKKEMKEERIFNYTGNYQTVCLLTGDYKMECWGANGGAGSGGSNPVGLGGYTSGEMGFAGMQTFYLYVGEYGNGMSTVTGFNGGGRAFSGSGHNGGRGGSASDIRLQAGAWNNTVGLRSRIMIAGGGGGAMPNCGGTAATAGHAGGLTGGTSLNRSGSYVNNTSYGGSQIAGGQYKVGSNGANNGVYGSFGTGAYANTCAAGGGSGYYGGGSQYTSGGGGGSSFISGYDGCNAIDVNGNHTGQSVHFSGLKFVNTVMKGGGEAIDGRLSTGYGKIKITLKN